jgi:hypothetical protein
VTLKNIIIPAYSTLSFTVEASEDTENPTIRLANVPGEVNPGAWITFDVTATDNGWGIDEFLLSYSTDGETWVEPTLMDFQNSENGTLTYKAWIKSPDQDTRLTVKANAVDFAGHESGEVTETVVVGTPPPPTYMLSIGSSPISGVSFTLAGESQVTTYSADLEEGSYGVEVPTEITIEGRTYNFVQWADGVTEASRTIELTEDTSITAQYEEAPIPEAGIPLWQIGVVVAVVAIVVVVVVLKMRKPA